MTSEIRNTTADMNAPDSLDRLLLLATGMSSGNPSDFIYAQERAGQQQLVNSTMLPTETRGDDKQQLADMGIALGDPDPDDPLFAPATLPDGWGKQASDHDMWSYIVDTLGRRRVAVFYKAAFYDRKAFMRVIGLDEYVREHVYGEANLVTDEHWATPEAIAQSALDLAVEEAKDIEQYQRFVAEPRDEADRQYWAKQIPKRQQRHDAYVAVAQKYGDADA